MTLAELEVYADTCEMEGRVFDVVDYFAFTVEQARKYGRGEDFDDGHTDGYGDSNYGTGNGDGHTEGDDGTGNGHGSHSYWT